jgi:hypothetical protein
MGVDFKRILSLGLSYGSNQRPTELQDLEVYGVDVSDIETGKLYEIFERIALKER